MRLFPTRLRNPLIAAAAIAALSGPALAQAPPAAPKTPAPAGQAPAAPPATAPPAQDTPPPAPAGPLADTSTSLFAERDNMLQLAGRLSSTSGDPARWQRYQDLRDGLLFTGARVGRETAEWKASAGADNVGWRDQIYFADYERVGRFKIHGLWDEIPQFYSVDTKTPYTSTSEGVLVLDDAAQQSIQNKTATLSAYVPIAPQFDLIESRAIGAFGITATPTPHFDITGAFKTTKHSGELPWGASFGFSNDAEVALPYVSRTNDLDVGLEWHDTRSMLRTAYTSSWFDNQASTLIWDSPLQLTDTATLPGRGRMALWPSNSMHTWSTAGHTKLAHRTQVTGSLAFGWWSNDQELQPFTINSALPTLTLPRATADAEAQTMSTNLSLVSRPGDDWRFSTRFRRYDFNNDTPATAIPQFINYDTAVASSATGGPEPFAHDRNTFDADATWMGLKPVALTVGYTNNHNGYDHRIFESSNENVLQLKADAALPRGMTFRTHYEYGTRDGSGLDEASLIQIGEQPSMRHYDLANRTRHRFVAQLDVAPRESLTFSVSGGVGTDDFDDSGFGLQESGFSNVSFGVDYQTPGGVSVGGTYNYERYTGLQRSRSANPGVQQTDPTRDWTVDSRENVHYFSIYVQPPRLGTRTEMRVSYDYSNATGNYLYEVGPALPPPSQLPEVYNKLQQFKFDLRHRLWGRTAATFSYTYEPFKVYDFAFDPTVVDSIVQPSSLVLGYTYRPYTTHSAVFGILYAW